MDHDVLSKIQIQSHIRKQISLLAKPELVIDKWQIDDDFESGYNKGYYAEYSVVMLKCWGGEVIEFVCFRSSDAYNDILWHDNTL